MTTIAQCADQVLKLRQRGVPRWKALRIVSEKGFTAEFVIQKELKRRALVARELREKGKIRQPELPFNIPRRDKQAPIPLDHELVRFLEKRERQKQQGFALAHFNELNRGFVEAGHDPLD